MKTGDNIIVTTKNTNTSMARLMRNFMYKISGKDTYDVGASASAMVV